MGTFEVTIEVGDPFGQRWEPITTLVDTGSTFTWIPGDVLRRLGVEPQTRWEFETADERIISRDVAETWVRYDGASHHTMIVFADDGAVPLLGAYTLEGFLLAADPVNRRLVPVHALAKRGSGYCA